MLVALALACPVQGQENRNIPITFLPPPIGNATYSLGIYDAKSGRLVRHLKEIAPESAFTVGLNGLSTNWDGKDDAGKSVPAARYAARGYAVGAMKVEGKRILGNDWANDDEALRLKGIDAIATVPADEGLAVLAYAGLGHWEVLRYSGTNGSLLWHQIPGPLAWTIPLAEDSYPHGSIQTLDDNVVVNIGGNTLEYRLADGAFVQRIDAGSGPDRPDASPGKDGSMWKIEDGVVSQYSNRDEKLRGLLPPVGEPAPQGISASTKSDRLYLLERASGWQRVRGLSWVETKEENGKPVSTWQTFFERNIRSSDLPNLGRTSELALVENPLVPGKTQRIVVEALVDPKGSYLATLDGLRLRQVSTREFLKAAKLEKSKSANQLSFFQTDWAAWDEFSIEGVKNMMEFDAGEIEMTAEGEKKPSEKRLELPDL